MTGALEHNFDSIATTLASLAPVQGPHLVVLPWGAIEGGTGAGALRWADARDHYETILNRLGELAQGSCAMVVPYHDKDDEPKVAFFHRGTRTNLDFQGFIEWGEVRFALDLATPSDLFLVFNAPSQVGSSPMKRPLRASCFVSIAGGDGMLIARGQTGYCQDKTITTLHPWEAGVLQLALDREGDASVSISEVYRSTPQFPSVCADERYEALRAGLRDYVKKNGIKGVVLGISGGIDSALCAMLAVDALGAEAVKGVRLPSRFTSDVSLVGAQRLAEQLGFELIDLPIEPLFEASLQTLAPLYGDRAWDVTEENLQARARAVLLMAVANKENRLLICTSNKAEAAMGYGTLYGDITGGYAPLIDLFKGDVVALCRARNAAAGRELIPEMIITRAPSAELREGQLDSDSLPPYDEIEWVISALLRKESLRALRTRLGDDTVNTIVHRFFANAYKRAQAIPGPAVSDIPLSLTASWGLGRDWLH